MQISVIVPTCNRYAALQECLRRLEPAFQGLEAGTYEVIVSDDSPDDGGAAEVKKIFPWVIWNRGPCQGPASNRNSGAARATGEWLVFTDDDCLPGPTLLRGYVEAITQYPQALVFEGATLPECPPRRLDEDAPLNENGGYLWSCNFMIQRRLFQSMDGFCPLFRHAIMEDVDLRERLLEAGHTFPFIPSASIVHPWTRIRTNLQWMRNRRDSVRLARARHPHLEESLRQLPISLLRPFVKCLLIKGPKLGYRGLPRWLWYQALVSWVLIQLALSGRVKPKPAPPP